MEMAVFEKLVDDLRSWGVELRRVNLYKDGESLLHPRFAEMVRLLKSSGVTREAWIKTNGLLLEPELNRQLIESGLDFIGVSVNAVDAEGYWTVTQTKVDYEKMVEGVRDLYERRGRCRIYVKIADAGFTEGQKRKFLDDFGPISDSCAIEQLHGWSASGMKDWTLGTNPTTFEGGPLVEKIACPLPFFMLAVNWNGTVSLCNEDWLHATICGDLREQSLREIWEGERLRELRRMHLEGRRSDNAACRDCYYLRTLPDNIDASRQEMLRRLDAAR